LGKEAYRRGRIDLPKNGEPRKVDMSLVLEKVLKELLTRRKAEALGQELVSYFHISFKWKAFRRKGHKCNYQNYFYV